MSSAYKLSDKKFEAWSSTEVAQYIQSKEDIGNYAELFQVHRIDGSIAHRITDKDLADMGITAIGDRHRIMAALQSLKEAKAQKDREKIIWTGTEVLYWSCCQQCCVTCCGCRDNDPEEYTLRFNYLEIKRPDSNQCGNINCCFGHSYEIDSIDLSNVVDVDVDGIPPPCFQECCCGAKTQEHVRVNVRDQTKGKAITTLKCNKPDGEMISRKIKNQVEVMQMMERS